MILSLLEKLIMNFYLTHLFSQKLTKTCKKIQKNLSKDNLKLEKTLQNQVEISLDASTQTCGACMTLKEKESNICLEIETSDKEKATFLKNFQVLENKLKYLQKDLKELNELHGYQIEDRYDLWRECAQAHKDYEDVKMSKQ